MSASSTYLHSTVAYCSVCETTEEARIVVRTDGVFMERVCPVSGTKRTKIASDVQWYKDRVSHPADYSSCNNPRQSEKGCPFDCGLCEWHNGTIRLPVFSITNDCNLNCPICFTYNRPDKKYYKTENDV